ncbi:MAG: class IV adenylate cyclase [Pyrinomonadaceae bacterium]|nr:class IV adenylate cyclase [Pyrinomonadaceae bacterium]MCX7639498.1 class IV adenylate cyclase [Pyrinomonadaceae bacterium]MDW8304451.1 class IV adenylate cyclase [Acidobacteriota bacterium]
MEVDKGRIKVKGWIEKEKKYRLTKAQYDEILKTLQSLQASFISEDFELNKLYTNEHLLMQKAILRLREKNDGKAVLTYKQRIQNETGVKEHVEYESEVSNPEAIERILESVGFSLKLVYEKRRKAWKIRGAEVCLDELPFGFFMEIEGSISSIIEVEAILGAENYEVEHETYPNLTARFGKKNNGTIEARFEK